MLWTRNVFLRLPGKHPHFQVIHAFRGGFSHAATRAASTMLWIAAMYPWELSHQLVSKRCWYSMNTCWGKDKTTRTLLSLLQCKCITTHCPCEQFGFVVMSGQIPLFAPVTFECMPGHGVVAEQPLSGWHNSSCRRPRQMQRLAWQRLWFPSSRKPRALGSRKCFSHPRRRFSGLWVAVAGPRSRVQESSTWP